MSALALCAITTLGFAASASARAPLTPVPSVNLNQYVGRWFQIATIPAIFEAVCAKDDTANYTFAADGNISVANDCTTRTGTDDQVTGEGRPDNAPADSTLSVSFIDFFGAKFFAPTPNYVIIGLDPAYQWAIVASPNRLTAFVLARSPTLTPSQIATTQQILSSNGISPCELQLTVQDGGAPSPIPYCHAALPG